MSHHQNLPTHKRQSPQLAEVVTALQRGLDDDLVALVLFGSRARGEADEASDWDLLLIAHRLPPKTLDRHLLLKSLLPVAWRAPVTILAKTPEEFESRLASLSLDIALDGVVLHDTDQYIAKRLAGLRRLIKKQGLRRERVQREMMWRWERFPGFDWALEWPDEADARKALGLAEEAVTLARTVIQGKE